MATWTRHAKGYVLVRTFSEGKQKRLPRAQTSHLDALADVAVSAWVDRLGAASGRSQYLDLGLMDSWLAYLKTRLIDAQTIAAHKSCLERFALPFFGAEGLAAWPQASIRLHDSLVEFGCTYSQIRKTNIALRQFWAWLYEEGQVSQPDLRLRNPVREQPETPLQRLVTPDEVLAWARRPVPPQVKLMGLAGYFFSLRPQELFALKRALFLSGSTVLEKPSSKAMGEAGLYQRLGVYIEAQRQNSGTVTEPKTKASVAWVNCFNEEAARLLVEMLNGLSLDAPLFELDNRKAYAAWEQEGLGITLKDLRRASIHWLGHETRLTPLQLQKHARHSSFATTLKYCRRPEERPSGGCEILNLEA